MSTLEVIHNYNLWDEIIFDDSPLPYIVIGVLSSRIAAARKADLIIDADYIAETLDGINEMNEEFKKYKALTKHICHDPLWEIIAYGIHRIVNLEALTEWITLLKKSEYEDINEYQLAKKLWLTCYVRISNWKIRYKYIWKDK